jgi:SAM-dependent methyltransferase
VPATLVPPFGAVPCACSSTITDGFEPSLEPDDALDRSPPPNLVKDMHEAVARSSDPVTASTRPPGTTRFELWIMKRDVARKLDPDESMAVLEVGCGTGIFAEPLARRARHYVGVDFACEAVDVLRERLDRQGLASKSDIRCLDFIALSETELHALGRFDRALMYATLHLARSDEEASEFLSRTVQALRPGGKALVGNLPLADLAHEHAPARRGLRARLGSFVAAMRRRPQQELRPRLWAAKSSAFFKLKGVAARLKGTSSAPGPSLPQGYTVDLNRERIERWLAEVPARISYQWVAPAVGVPLHRGRMDLMISRDE